MICSGGSGEGKPREMTVSYLAVLKIKVKNSRCGNGYKSAVCIPDEHPSGKLFSQWNRGWNRYRPWMPSSSLNIFGTLAKKSELSFWVAVGMNVNSLDATGQVAHGMKRLFLYLELILCTDLPLRLDLGMCKCSNQLILFLLVDWPQGSHLTSFRQGLWW